MVKCGNMLLGALAVVTRKLLYFIFKTLLMAGKERLTFTFILQI